MCGGSAPAVVKTDPEADADQAAAEAAATANNMAAARRRARRRSSLVTTGGDTDTLGAPTGSPLISANPVIVGRGGGGGAGQGGYVRGNSPLLSELGG